MVSRWKPAASRRTHVLLAACLWSVIGLFLMIRSCQRLVPEFLPFLLIAFAAGLVKSLYVLDKMARKILERNMLMADGSCLGAVYSKKTWILILVMICAGVLLRYYSISPVVLGSIYGAVGSALLFSSRALWRAWSQMNNE
jgi:hypothetical protein